MFKSKEKSHRLGTRKGMVEDKGVEWAELLLFLGGISLLSNKQLQ